MQKNEAQMKNEKEVRRIMEERGYNDFWEEKADNNSKSTKTKKIIVGLIFVIVPIIGLGSIFVNMYLNNQKEQTKEALRTCLEETDKIYSATAEAGASEVGRYASLIECHEKYKTDTYDQSVASLNELRTQNELDACLKEADNNYSVSDEEMANAGTDVNALLILVKRVGSGIDAKMSCHNKYKTAGYETAMNKLKADKSENEAYIDDANNAIKMQQYQSQSSSRSYTHCTSNSYGNSIYTNCY